ncbi:MAG: hypothetical protein GXZ11_01455 [Tissierellia bacterium]|nr:hypothetical protein [Tissierellia bacterium]
MNEQQKIRDIRKIIDKYFKILETLPNGGKIDPKIAKKLGIPESIAPIIERAYKAGRLKGKSKGNIPLQDIENEIKKEMVPKTITQLQGYKTEEDLSHLLTKARAKYSRQTIDYLKRDMGVISTVFKDEPIPKEWIAQELRKITGDTKQDWDMVIRTELKNNDLEGMASAILDNKSPLSNDGAETRIFKQPNPDACKHCKRLYLEPNGLTPRVFKLGELMANGTNIGKKVADWQATLGTLHPHCYDDETEVLTNNGFKLFKDLAESDLVYTVDPETMHPEWQKPINYIAYHHKGEMLHFKNARFDMMVTPEHKMLIQSQYTRKKGKGYKLIEADLAKNNTNHRIPSGINWRGENKKAIDLGGREVDVETYLKFMAYWLSDGSCTFYNNKYYIQIHQDNIEWVYKELKNLPFKVYKCKRALLIHDEALGRELTKYGKSYQKYIPESVKRLTPEHIKLFLINYAKCDGHIRKPREWKGYTFRGEITFYTSSNQLAADIAELIMKAGGKPAFYLDKTKGKEVTFKNGTYTINHNIWRIRWNSQTHSFIRNMQIERLNYDGMVYCVEVPKHHTLYVRRNGRCAWSGNCQCTLHVMPENAEFDEMGNLVYRSDGDGV